MPRPRRKRKIGAQPGVTYYKPRGVSLRLLEEVVLGLDEFEALRLVDCLGYDQNQSAKKMGISQSTLQRILSSARKKASQGLTEGKAIRIESGSIEYRCPRRKN